MFIKEIEIHDNKRLGIRGTKRLTVSYTEVQQIILGGNGSGKSSLIRELSPLPPNGNDYSKGGYKKIVIEHRNKEYQLTSTFNKSAGEHSFINLETNEELNPGGTQSVQRTLVNEIFNFDDSLFEVLTDQVKFTSMSPTQRREWLTRISGTNLDYAIDIFNKVKKAQRDEEAVTKHFTQRLNKESDKVPTKQELDSLNKQMEDLVKYQEFLRENKFFLEYQTTIDDSIIDFQEKLKYAKKLSESILRLSPCIPNSVKSITEFKQHNNLLSIEINNIEEQIKKLELEYVEVANIIKETQSGSDLSELEKTLKEQIDNRTQLMYPKEIFIEKLDTPSATMLGYINAVKDELIDTFSEMIDNSEEYFSKEKFISTEEKINALQTELTKLKNRKETINHRLYHYENTNDVNCEKCGHMFKPGLKSEDLPKIKQALEHTELEIDKLNSAIDNEKAYLEETQKYISNYKKVIQVAKSLPALKPLWDKIFATNFNKGSTKPCINLIGKATAELETLVQLEIVNNEIYKLESIINKIKQVNSTGYYTEQKLNSLIHEINKLGETKKVKGDELFFWEKEYEHVIEFFDSLDRLNILLKELLKLKTYINNKYANDWINNSIKETSISIGTVAHKQNDVNSTLKIIEDINNSRNKSMEKTELLKLIVNEINPTTGLIAEFFQQFINQFVDQINIVVGKIWNHSFELLPCSVDDNGLTYKFPLRINDADFGPPDCSKGSNSQISVVNFAFKIVVMIYLGLEDYPLYLDELAPDLDEKHRVNIMMFVRDFVESKRCSQMFMVSHYETGYGAFTNAEILVLDKENLLNIPKSYNTHVSIIRHEDV